MKLTNEELKIAKKRYNRQQSTCQGRLDKLGNLIEFKLTFDQWIDIWLQSGHWHERGRGKNQYVMSRFNDTGHYEIGNVEIKTSGDNIREMRSTDQYRKNYLVAMEKMHNNLDFLEKKRVLMNSIEFQERRRAGIQKAHNKPISCNGVIYPSRMQAALVIAPATRLTINSKDTWLGKQMKKYPERYFYV